MIGRNRCATLGPQRRKTTQACGYGSRIALGFASLVRDDKNYAAAVVTPPSTTMVCPVMKVDASEAR